MSTALAEQRLAAALQGTGAQDPRGLYRERLVALRERDREAFRRALSYFETKLVPEVARDGSDPLGEWLEYGKLLAELTTPGAAVQIDPSGRKAPFARPIPVDRLVLHLPTSVREAAIVIALPPRLSPAQQATYDLLVLRKTG